MPNYPFKCTSCDHKFEVVLPMKDSDKPIKEKCPSCKKKKVIKDWGEYSNGNKGVVMDATLSPAKVCGSAWKDVMDKIKHSGQVPKRFHERLDRSTHFRDGSVS